MYDQTVHKSSIARHFKASDFVKDPALLNPPHREQVIGKAVALGQSGFKGISLTSSQLRGKTIYHVTDTAQLLLLRHLNANVRRLTSVKQDNRQFIVECISQLLREGVPFNVYKFDISKFYESTNSQQIVQRLQSDVGFSGQSARALASFFDELRAIGITGLPRGMSISATLSEYLLRDLDSKISGLEGVWFYARFVDDILLIRKSQIDTSKTFEDANNALPLGLKFNSKSKPFEFQPYAKKKSSDLEHTLDFLGYEFNVSHVYRDNKNSKLLRDVRIDISESKVKKLKTRFALSVVQFNQDRNFDDLHDRTKLLTSNFRFKDRDTGAIRSSGIYFNYPLVDAATSKALTELDRFVRNTLHSPHGKNRIRPALSATQRQQLCRLTFSAGFAQKRFYSFKDARLAELVSCWTYV